MIDHLGNIKWILETVGVVAFGTLDTSSATVPADSARTEANDHFKEMYLMPLEGTYRGVCKRIVSYTGVGGIFNIDASDPYLGVTGLVTYAVVNRYHPPILGANLAASIYNTVNVLPDRDGDIVHRLEWLIAVTSGDYGILPILAETWQDVLGIDFTIWNTPVGAGGTVVRSVATEPHQEVRLAGVAAADTARLASVQEWQLAPDTYGVTLLVQRLILEWEAQLDNVADAVNATFMMGWGALALATRATNNIAAVILVGDAYNFVTDDGGVETVTPIPSAPAPGARHKFKIIAYAGTIELWVDEVLEVTHTTAAAENLPDVLAHIQFYLVQEGAGTALLHVGPLGARPQAID